MLWTDEGSRLASHILDAEVAVSDHFHVECAAGRRHHAVEHGARWNRSRAARRRPGRDRRVGPIQDRVLATYVSDLDRLEGD